MNANCAKNLFGFDDLTSKDKIALALEQTTKSLSQQYQIPPGIIRARFRRKLWEIDSETYERMCPNIPAEEE